MDVATATERKLKGKIVIELFDDAVPEFSFIGDFGGRDIGMVHRKLPKAYHTYQDERRKKEGK